MRPRSALPPGPRRLRGPVDLERGRERTTMFGLKRIHIARHERGLLFHERSFEAVLEPGVRWIFDPLRRTEIEVRDLTVPEFEHPRVDILLDAAGASASAHFHVVELEDREVGL